MNSWRRGDVRLEALAYYRASPALMFFAHEAVPPGDVIADLRQKIRDVPIDVIVVHPDPMDAMGADQTIALLRSIEILTPVATAAAVAAFRVRQASR